MPVARNKSEAQELSQPKVSVDMLRNAQIVDETATKSAVESTMEEQSREKSMETFNRAEIVDETPQMDSSNNETDNNKIEPEVKVVDSMLENDVMEKFKKVESNEKTKKELEFLLNKNQQLLSENSKLKLEFESLRRLNSDLNFSISDLNRTKETELNNQINDFRVKYADLKREYQQLTEIHKQAIIDTPDKPTPKPIIEEQPVRIKNSKAWEPPTHNPYKSFSKKYRN